MSGDTVAGGNGRRWPVLREAPHEYIGSKMEGISLGIAPIIIHGLVAASPLVRRRAANHARLPPLHRAQLRSPPQPRRGHHHLPCRLKRHVYGGIAVRSAAPVLRQQPSPHAGIVSGAL